MQPENNFTENARITQSYLDDILRKDNARKELNGSTLCLQKDEDHSHHKVLLLWMWAAFSILTGPPIPCFDNFQVAGDLPSSPFYRRQMEASSQVIPRLQCK